MNKLIERNLIGSGYKASVIISGGGSSFISNILKFPGASEFVVDAQIPYSKEALFECLKNKYPSFVIVMLLLKWLGLHMIEVLLDKI